MSREARLERRENAKLMTQDQPREKQTLSMIELELGKHELNKVAMAVQAIIQTPQTVQNEEYLADLRSYVQCFLLSGELTQPYNEPTHPTVGGVPASAVRADSNHPVSGPWNNFDDSTPKDNAILKTDV